MKKHLEQSHIFIKNHLVIISVIAFTFSFILSKLNYFFLMQLPAIHPDCYEYFWVSEMLSSFNISGVFQYPLELPLGYPVFINLISLFSENIETIVFTQFIINYISSLFLLLTLIKFYKNHILIFTFIFCLLCFDNQLYLFDSSLLTESIFRSLFILIVPMIVWMLKTDKKKYWILFSLVTFCISVIRPNGIYIYFLVPALAFYIYLNKKSYKLFWILIIPFLMINFSWAIFNYHYKDYFMIGDFKRITNITKQNNENSLTDFTKKKADIFYSYLLIAQNERKCFQAEDMAYPYWFYINRLKDTLNIAPKPISNYLSAKIDKLLSKPEKSKYFNSNQDYLYKDRFIQINTMNNAGDIYIGVKGIFLLFNNLSRYIVTPLYNSIIWLFLFYFIFAISAFRSIKYKFRKVDDLIIFILSLIHILSIITITIFHNRYLPRYEYPTSFLIYIVIGLSPILIDYKIKIKKNDQ